MIIYQYIYDEQTKTYYVLEAPSLIESATRDMIFKKHFSQPPESLKEEKWKELRKKHKVRTLEE